MDPDPSPAFDEDAPPPPRSAEVAAGLRTALPAGMAYVPLGFALGVLVVQKGLAWWWAPVFGGFIFAGSLEFLLVGLVTAVAPLTQIALSAFLVNFRHVFYALSFPLGRVRGRAARAYSTFALTDEAYALAAAGDSWRWSGTRIVTMQASLQLFWLFGVTSGALLGQLIPPEVVGLDFAVTALFVVLALDAFKVRRSIPVPAAALVCSAVAALVTPHEFLVTAMGLFVLVLIAGYWASGRRRDGRAAAHPEDRERGATA